MRLKFNPQFDENIKQSASIFFTQHSSQRNHMIFTATALKDAFIIDLEEKPDHRGFFARSFCAQEFEAHGLKPTVAQCNLSFNYKKGTIRGMHYQVLPAAETKLIRCTKGAIYDVIIDMRPESPSFLSHIGVELTPENHRALYVPEMFAHGYQALTDETEVVYQVGEFYTPGYERGLRYDDPFFNIDWPLDVTEISEKDLSWPLLRMMTVGGTSR
jgi:dTDP-4-dehydrorhamnose 3,5-epimerase